jgi:hypothetical protein
VTTLYATDLDRTLVYSERAAGRPVDGLVPVEEYQGRTISWISPAQRDLLAAVAGLALVVPVTTRTQAQYRRITLWDAPPEWAVVANGGTILHRGEPDAGWSALVRAQLDEHCHELGAVAEVVATRIGPWLDHVRTADDLFVYTLVDRDALPAGAVAGLAAALDPAGWVVSVQGRKLYAVPRPLLKSAAVTEVRARTGAGRVFAAGDSLLDRDLLAAADRSLRPAHGELHDIGAPADHVTATSGIDAGEELLRTVLGWLDAPPTAPGTGRDEESGNAGGRVRPDQRAGAAQARHA